MKELRLRGKPITRYDSFCGTDTSRYGTPENIIISARHKVLFHRHFEAVLLIACHFSCFLCFILGAVTARLLRKIKS